MSVRFQIASALVKASGMKKTAETPIKDGGTMYTMERDYRDE